MINDPETIKHVLSTKFREGVYGKGPFQIDQYKQFIGTGIFNSNGALWKHQRSQATPAFQPSALKSHVAIFEKQGKILLDKFESLWKNDPIVKTNGIDVQDYFMRFTLDSFSNIAFGNNHFIHSSP
jgi:cytochrome P450